VNDPDLYKSLQEARQLIEESRKVIGHAEKVLSQSPIITGYAPPILRKLEEKNQTPQNAEDSS
jgi:hypothetical protein